MSYNRNDIEDLQWILQRYGYSLDNPYSLQELVDISSLLEEIQYVLDRMGLALDDLANL